MKTYTMYLRRTDEPRASFEPVMCADDAQAMGKARELLRRTPEVDSVEIYLGEHLLVTVS